MNNKIPLFEWLSGISLVDDDDDQAANCYGDGTAEENELSPVVDYERESTRDDVMVHDNPPDLVDDDTTPVSNAYVETGVNDNSGDNLPDITDHVSLEPDVSINNNFHGGDALADDGRNVDGTHNDNAEDQDGGVEPGANGFTDAGC